MEEATPPLDQLKQFALDGKADKTPVGTLDLRAYWFAIGNGAPIPRFRTKGNTPLVNASRVTQILNSPWDDETYSAINQIELPIVRDIRRRHREGRLLRRDKR